MTKKMKYLQHFYTYVWSIYLLKASTGYTSVFLRLSNSLRLHRRLKWMYYISFTYTPMSPFDPLLVRCMKTGLYLGQNVGGFILVVRFHQHIWKHTRQQHQLLVIFGKGGRLDSSQTLFFGPWMLVNSEWCPTVHLQDWRLLWVAWLSHWL